MRTTINISDALLEELRSIARTEKRPFRRVVEETLQRGLSCGNPEQTFQVRAHPVGIKKPYQGMSMNQLYDQLESESTLKVAEP
jgi:hypothetical protein